MENIKQLILNWYQDVGCKNPTSLLYLDLIKLIKDLKRNGLETDQGVDVANALLKIYQNRFEEEIVQTIFETSLIYKIKKAFDISFTDIKEVVEEDKYKDVTDSGVRVGEFTTVLNTEVEDLDYEEVKQTQEDRDFLASIRFEGKV